MLSVVGVELVDFGGHRVTEFGSRVLLRYVGWIGDEIGPRAFPINICYAL